MPLACFHCDQDLETSLGKAGVMHRCGACQNLNVILTGEAPLQFGDYQLWEIVGVGANAVVCRAVRSDGKTVAAKVFYAHREINNHSRREFTREIEQARKLDHPSIIKVNTGGERNGVLFLELEYFDAVNLIEYLNIQGPMAIDLACEVGARAAEALDYVWSKFMIIHRDVKPQNIMLNSHGVVKVCDFGMVTAYESGEVDVSAVEGTPYYLSPESILDGAYPDNRSDIYSLGATLYHVVSGQPPFDLEEIMAVVHARLHQPPPDLRKVRADCSTPLAAVVYTMMARDPNYRYDTGFDCGEDLRRAGRGERPRLIDTNAHRARSNA